MISTATTKLEHPRPEDGTLRDLDPTRRGARLRAGAVRIERVRPLHYVVHLPDGSRHQRRTRTGAERLGHTFLDHVGEPVAMGAARTWTARRQVGS